MGKLYIYILFNFSLRVSILLVEFNRLNTEFDTTIINIYLTPVFDVVNLDVVELVVHDHTCSGYSDVADFDHST